MDDPALKGLPSLKYEKLPDSGYFCLVKTVQLTASVIRLEMDTVPLASPPVYIALSYTWGTATPDDGMTADRNRTVICNGKAICVTENL